MRNGRAHLRARLRDLVFSLPLSRDAFPDSGPSSHYAGIARLRAASTRNVFRDDTRSVRRGNGFGNGDGTRSNLAAVGSLPPREVTRSRFLFSSRTVILWTGRNRACQSGYRE